MDKKSTIQNGITILKDVFGVMPNSFLILGTALGAVRENDFILNKMFDIDVGIMSDDFEWKQITELIRRGFDIRLVLGKRNYGLSIHLIKDDIHTDILLFYRNENRVWSVSWLFDLEMYHEFSEEAFEITEQEIGGNRFRSLGKKYLEEYYGENWKTPQELFDWLNEPQSIKFVLQDKQFQETGYNIYMNKNEGEKLLGRVLQKKFHK